MQVMTKEELEKVEGGLSFWGGVGIVGVVLFIIGLVDGFTRPLDCH